MEERLIKQDFWVKDELLVVEDVPTGVCPQCGEKVVRAEVGQRLAALLADPHRAQQARRISVPVIGFLKEVA
jgi:YgiT-type zinc finger domain-containing protein